MELADLLLRGEAALQDAIDQGTFESLTLDFKSAEGLFSGGSLTREGRKVLARAMSGFANSAGGLIVIGVDCRAEDGIDKARALGPVSHLSRAFSSVNGQLAELLQPRHEGIRAHGIRASGGDDEGYVIIEVPRSERRPHMNGQDRTYHKRSSASTFVMEHYDVEDAFRRVAAPDLHLRWRLERGYTDGKTTLAIRVQFEVENRGPTTAKSVAITLGSFVGPPLQIPTTNTLFSTRNVGSKVVLVAPPHLVINPAQTVPFHMAAVSLSRQPAQPVYLGTQLASQAVVEVEVELSAENMAPQSAEITLGPTDFAPFISLLERGGL